MPNFDDLFLVLYFVIEGAFLDTTHITGNLTDIFCDGTQKKPRRLQYLWSNCLLPEVDCACCELCCQERICTGINPENYVPDLPVCWR